MMDKDKRLLGFVAIALAVVFTIYLSAMPPQDTAEGLAALAPAAGDAVPGSVGAAPDRVTSDMETARMPAQPEAVPQEPEGLEKGEVYSVVQIFDTEQACKDATSRACHLVKCEGDDPVAGTEDEATVRAVENACAENEKTGWRPVVPVPDKTAIPDVIAPPADLTTE